MNLVQRVFISLALMGTELVADEGADFRQAWNQRLAEHATAQYQASGVRLIWTMANDRRVAHRTELQVVARLKNDERKARFDISSEGNAASLHILDKRDFHTSVQRGNRTWHAESSSKLTPESEWPFLYPFLLAHGVVPLPPFEVPRTPVRFVKPALSTDGVDVRNREATFPFEGEPPRSVTISHDNNGFIATYHVSENSRRLLEVSNTYERVDGSVRLGRFSVVKFGSDGRPVGRFDAQVDQCRMDLPLPAGLFVQPRDAKATQENLLSLLNNKVDMRLTMTLGDLEGAIQAALGQDIRVRIDQESFLSKYAAVKLDDLVFEPGELSLENVLWNNLRRNRLDFYFDSQGIVLFPRNQSWPRTEHVEYVASDYGLTTDALRDLLYSTALHDEWSEVGGAAMLVVDEEQGRVNIVHTPSDHFRFLHRLNGLPKK